MSEICGHILHHLLIHDPLKELADHSVQLYQPPVLWKGQVLEWGRFKTKEGSGKLLDDSSGVVVYAKERKISLVILYWG